MKGIHHRHGRGPIGPSSEREVEPPVSLSERIRIQECYLDGLRKLREGLNMSIAEGGEVLKELLDEQARKDFEADLLSLEDEEIKGVIGSK